MSKTNGIIFDHYMKDPRRYSIAELDKDKNVLSVQNAPLPGCRRPGRRMILCMGSSSMATPSLLLEKWVNALYTISVINQ